MNQHRQTSLVTQKERENRVSLEAEREEVETCIQWPCCGGWREALLHGGDVRGSLQLWCHRFMGRCVSVSSYLQQPTRQVSASIQDVPTVCKACLCSRSMRDESGGGFALEMPLGGATAGAGESNGGWGLSCTSAGREQLWARLLRAGSFGHFFRIPVLRLFIWQVLLTPTVCQALCWVFAFKMNQQKCTKYPLLPDLCWALGEWGGEGRWVIYSGTGVLSLLEGLWPPSPKLDIKMCALIMFFFN